MGLEDRAFMEHWWRGQFEEGVCGGQNLQGEVSHLPPRLTMWKCKLTVVAGSPDFKVKILDLTVKTSV